MKNRSASVLNFFFEVIKSQSLLIVAWVVSAFVLWGVDANIRSLIIRYITDNLTVQSSFIFGELAPYVAMFIGSLALRLVILRSASYANHVYLMPRYKIYILDYFARHFMHNADVTNQKHLESYSNKLQELIKFFEDFFNLVFVSIVCSFVALTVAMISFYYMSAMCFWCLVGLIFVFMSVGFCAYQRQVLLSEKDVASNLKIFSEFNDIVFNLFHVKTLNNQKYENDRFQKFYKEYKQAMANRRILDVIILTILSFVFSSYHALFLLFLLWQFQKGIIDKSAFVCIFMLNLNVPEYLWTLMEDLSEISKIMGKSQKVLNGLTLDPAVKPVLGAPIELKKYDIVFKDVVFNYSDNQTLFNHLSFTIESNTKVGIIGASGSGKSSILSLLLKLREVNGGAIYINGVNIQNFSCEMISSFMTIMTQDVSLFNRTISENIAYGRREATKEDIENAAKQANIHDFIQTLPDAYDTVVESNGKEFSYGQRQRLLIARAFLRDTPILLLDEITASLDNKSEDIVLKSLAALMKNRTVIMIAHKLYTLKNMDKLIMFNNGKILCEGTHESLLQNAHYCNLLNLAV